jgi:hypothetical protein
MDKRLIAALVLLGVVFGVTAYRSIFEVFFVVLLFVSFVVAGFSALVLLSGKSSRTLYWAAGGTSAVLLSAMVLLHTGFAHHALGHALDVELGTGGALTVGFGAIAGIWFASLKLSLQTFQPGFPR